VNCWTLKANRRTRALLWPTRGGLRRARTSAARTLPRAARFFFDEIDGPVRDQFLRAKRGDLVGPVQTGNEYALYLIEDKVLPSARDPQVRRRAEEGVLQHALDQQLDRRVQWHVSP
jgi:hypothetical protein